MLQSDYQGHIHIESATLFIHNVNASCLIHAVACQSLEYWIMVNAELAHCYILSLVTNVWTCLDEDTFNMLTLVQ